MCKNQLRTRRLTPLAVAIISLLGASGSGFAWAGNPLSSASTTGDESPVALAQGPGNLAQQSADSTDTPQARAEAAAKQKKKQEKKAITLGAITVTGFVNSLNTSTAIQRESNNIVEAVTAERIGQLPGSSIAATLGRQPGLSTQISNGRASVLSIHGLGPDFSTVLLDGNEQASTGTNRDVNLNNYPSSWFGSVVVHLTPNAALVGQGLAGTVNLQTIQPLDLQNMKAAVNANYIWNSNGRLVPQSAGPGTPGTGHDFNGVFVDQFADHTFGVTLGIDIQSTPQQTYSQGNGGGFQLAPGTGPNGPLIATDTLNELLGDVQNRNSGLLTLQWRPSSFFSSTLTTTYSKFKDIQNYAIQEIKAAGPNAYATFDPSSVINGIATSGILHDITPMTRGQYLNTRNSVLNVNWTNTIHPFTGLTFNVGGDYSRATSSRVIISSEAGYGLNFAGPTADYTFQQSPGGPVKYSSPFNQADLSSLMITDPQGFGQGSNPPVIQAGFLNLPNTSDYIARAFLNGDYEFDGGPISDLEFGLDGKERHKTSSIIQAFLIPLPGATSVPFPPGTAITSGLSGPFGIGPIVAFNSPNALFNSPNAVMFPTSLSTISVPPDWTVRERDLISYLQADIDTNLGSVSLRGNFGVQMVHTNQRSTGAIAQEVGVTGSSYVTLVPVTAGASFNKWLPSINLVFGLSPENDLRVSAAKTIARPELQYMSASNAVVTNPQQLESTDPNNGFFKGQGGNPDLRPTDATNFNVSLEHYFGGGTGFNCDVGGGHASELCQSGAGGGGFVALSGYYVKLRNFINPNAAILRDFGPVASTFLGPDQLPLLGTSEGLSVEPQNDGNGSVRGEQASVNLPFGLFARSLSSLGMLASVNHSNSSLTYGTNSQGIPVPGLSTWVNQATLYFSHKEFQARISRSYRSDYTASVGGNSAQLVVQDIASAANYSAQVSYTFSHGPLEGLAIIASGDNLTNEPQLQFKNGVRLNVTGWSEFGRTYNIGVSYQL